MYVNSINHETCKDGRKQFASEFARDFDSAILTVRIREKSSRAINPHPVGGNVQHRYGNRNISFRLYFQVSSSQGFAARDFVTSDNVYYEAFRGRDARQSILSVSAKRSPQSSEKA
jgi:hypothetical protein